MLQIHLSHDGPYKPGSVVSGRVALSSRSTKGESVDTQAISVVFTARCTTKNGSLDVKSPNHGNVILYTHERKLFTGPRTLHAPASWAGQRDRDPHSWPFEFMVPIHCALAQAPHFVKDANFDDDKDQQLPPSFKDDDPDPDGVCFANILHELIATLTTSKKKLFSSTPKTIEAKCPLDLVRSHREKVPPETMATIDVGWYHSDGDIFPIEPPPRIGLRIAVGLSKSNSVPAPSADFTMQFRFPLTAQLGHPIPVFVNVPQDSISSTSAPLPEILLRRLSLQLQTVTLVRGTYGKALEDTRRDTHRWDSSQTVLSCVFGQPLKLKTEETVDLRRFADLKFEPNVVPSFKTFNVSRQYYLSATFVIVVDGRTSQPTSTERSLLAITRSEDDVPMGGAASGTRNAQWSGSVVEEQLPPYGVQS